MEEIAKMTNRVILNKVVKNKAYMHKSGTSIFLNYGYVDASIIFNRVKNYKIEIVAIEYGMATLI